MYLLLLAAIVLFLLFQRPRESFQNPSQLSAEEYEALLETPTGRALKTELLNRARSQSIPNEAIPDYVNASVKTSLDKAWMLYSSLSDKSKILERIQAMTMSPEAIRQDGRPLAEAYTAFLENYYSKAPTASKEITKTAGPIEPISKTDLASLLESVKDPKVRDMLSKYSTHMVRYYTTGEAAHKAAADREMQSFQEHVQNLNVAATEDSKKISEAWTLCGMRFRIFNSRVFESKTTTKHKRGSTTRYPKSRAPITCRGCSSSSACLPSE